MSRKQQQGHNDLEETFQKSINNQYGKGTYQVCEPIKRGSDGYVYKIEFIKNKTYGALKVLPKFQIQFHKDSDQNDNMDGSREKSKKKQKYIYKANKKMEERAKNQISIYQSLNRSSYILKLINSYEDEHNVYLLLEYFPRGDLGNYITQHSRGLPLEKVQRIGLELIKGIDTIHKQKIIHRDIKPQNILLGEKDEIAICDFSRAMKMDEIVTNKKKPKEAIKRDGTRAYLAPISKVEDQKVDIWSYGCTLYEMATGRKAFTGVNVKEELIALCFEKMPSALINLLRKILIIDPCERISYSEIISHPFFTTFDPNKIQKEQFIENPLRENKNISQSVEILNKNSALQRWRTGGATDRTSTLKSKIVKSNYKPSTEQNWLKIDERLKRELWKNEEKNNNSLGEQQKQNNLRYSNMPLKNNHHLALERKQKTTIDDLMNYKLKSNKTEIVNAKSDKPTQLTCKNIPFGSVTTKDEVTCLSKEGLRRRFKSGKEFIVSPCGSYVKIVCGEKEKVYEYSNLPEKYFKEYESSKKILEILEKDKKNSTSRPKRSEHSLSSNPQKQSRRRVSEKLKINNTLQSNYISPHFGHEMSSLHSSKLSSENHNDEKNTLSYLPNTTSVTLELNLFQKTVHLQLDYDHRREYLTFQQEERIYRFDEEKEKEEKIRKLLMRKFGIVADMSSVRQVSLMMESYFSWFQSVPAQKMGRIRAL